MAMKSAHCDMIRTMLPFLYQTRTMCSRGYFQPTAAQFRRSLHVSPTYCKRRTSASIRYENRAAIERHKLHLPKDTNKPLRGNAEGLFRDQSVGEMKSVEIGPYTGPGINESSIVAMEPGITGDSKTTTQESNSFKDGEIPFLCLPDSFDNSEISGKILSRRGRDSTITIRERLAFDRIFADIMASSTMSSTWPDQVFSAIDNKSIITTKAPGPGETPESMINDALKSTGDVQFPSSDTWNGKDNQEELRTAVHRYPPTLRAAAARALGLASAWSPLQSQEQKRLQEQEHSHAQEHSQAQERSQEEERSSLDRLEKIRQPERQRVENLMRDATNDADLWQIMEDEVFSLIERLGLSKDPSRAEGDIKSRQLEPLGRFVYGPLYPSHLLFGLRLLDRSFAKPSPLVLNVLPRIKSLGIISHVLGASTAFYNELLRIYWSRYDNFLGVLELLNEMELAVLEFDEETLSIVHEINHMQFKVRRGDQGSALQVLWSMPEFAPGKFKAWKKKIKSLLDERESDASGVLA